VSVVTTDRGRRGGFTLLGVGPPLALLGWWLTGAYAVPGEHISWRDEGSRPEAVAAYPDEFPLFPTMGNEGASGRVVLRQLWSPYGVSVDESGSVQYGLTVRVAGLPEIEGESYQVWLTTPSLEHIVPIGVVASEGEIEAINDFHQLMVVVSREPAGRDIAPGDRWQGPVVLRGFSAGARVTPLAQHSLFRPSPM